MQDKSVKGHTAMLVASILWGLSAPVSKEVLNAGVSALTLTTFRMVGGAAAFWIASLFVKQEHVNHKDLLQLFFAALFSIVLNQGTFVFGLSLTSPIDASVVTTMLPIVTMIVAAFYLKEPVTGKKVLGVFIGAMGALILILSNKGNLASHSGSIWGDLLCLSAQFSFAIYLTFFRDLIKKYSGITIMKWMFIYASMCFVPFSYHDLTQVNFSEIPSAVYLEIAYVVIGATFVSYLLIMVAQKTLRPTVVSMYNYVQPIVASIVAVAIGIDTFGLVKSISIVLVFLGVYVVTQSKSREQMEAYEKQKEN
ncbi:MAG: DMT family transporter [Paludibacteraceae bacterium]|nr:DMT family transporter [Paludibacteraceae bacterium]